MTFKAYAIQKEPFADAVAAWGQVPLEVSTEAQLYEAIDRGGPVALTDDIDLTMDKKDNCDVSSWDYDYIEIVIDKDCDLDLGGNTLTLRGSVIAEGGSTITISNGTLDYNLCDHMLKDENLSFNPIQISNTSLTLNDVIISEVISGRSIEMSNFGSGIDATLTVNGGEINGVIGLYAGTSATINGTGMNCIGDAFQMWSNTTLNINDATINCNHLIKAMAKSMTGNIDINGGTFTVKPTDSYPPLIWGNGSTSANITKNVSGDAILNGGPFSWE